MSRPGKGTDHVERLAQEPGECGRSERSLYAETSASGRAGVVQRRLRPKRENSVGSTNSVRRVEETSPPMTTVASGRWTSAPTPVFTAIGMNPRLATRAVMSTGRSL